KPSAAHQHNPLLHACVDPVVLLYVKPERIQCFLRNTDLVTNACNGCPVNDRHRAEQRVCGQRDEQHRRGDQTYNDTFPTMLSHNAPFAPLLKMSPSPADVLTPGGK